MAHGGVPQATLTSIPLTHHPHCKTWGKPFLLLYSLSTLYINLFKVHSHQVVQKGDQQIHCLPQSMC